MWESLFKLLFSLVCIHSGWVYSVRPIELYEHRQVQWFSILRRLLPKPAYLIYARIVGSLLFAVGCLVLVVAGRELLSGVPNG